MLPLLPHSINYEGDNSTVTHWTTGAIPRARKERTTAVISENSQLTTSAPENSSIIDVPMFLRTERVITIFWLEATCSNSSPSGCGQHRLARRPVTIPTDRGVLSYLAPLGSENISAPYFKQCQTPRLPVPRQK